MRLHVIDTETTGLDPATDRVVEIAAIEVREVEVDGAEPRAPRWAIGPGDASFVKPGVLISFEAMGVHHIIESDVADAPELGEALDRVLTPFWRETVDIVVGHNCRFDRDMLLPLREKRWLDTYRCSLHIWPDAPNHKNAVLYYWLGFPRPALVNAHSALFDARLTANILCRLLAERSVDELLHLSTKAAVLKKVGFGMHFGKLWTEVPTGYLEWARGQDFDPDVKFTVKTELARRSSGSAS